MLSEEVCSQCETIYDCHIGEALRGAKDEIVCPECYRTTEAEEPIINEEK